MDLSSYLEKQTVTDEVIIKSAHDKRIYSTIKLDNGMRIIWINDPNTVKSAASMTVGVGHFSDGKVKGMAHLLEHMLFMGTSKYKDVEFYNKKIAEFGGSSNAYTSHDHTNYYFDVSNDHLAEMLEIFSRFFIDPSLDESCIDKEKNAVDSEHNKNIMNDGWRYEDILRKFGKHKSPFSAFSTGNLETFDVKNLHERLKEFYDKYYSSDIMTLVIVSDKKITDLINETQSWKDYISSMFNMVPNKLSLDMICDEYNNIEMFEKHNNYLEMVPIKDEDVIKLLWEIRCNKADRLLCDFIAHIIGHEGENTLISKLRKNLWINNVSVFHHEPVGHNTLFEIKIKISPDGKNHTTQIINMVMYYIYQFKTTCEQHPEKIKELYNEYAKMTINDFIYQDKEDSIDYVASLSAIVNYVMNFEDGDIKDVVIWNLMFDNFTDDLCESLKNILNSLNIERINIIAGSHSFKNCTSEIEKYYGINYTLTIDTYASMLAKINKSFSVLEKYKSCSLPICISNQFVDVVKNDIKNILEENMQLPSVNEFIATNFDINNDDFSQKYPSVIMVNGIKLYYKPHSEQRKSMPQTSLLCSIDIDWLDVTTEEGARNNTIMSLYMSCINKSINDFMYMCGVASYSVSLSSSNGKLNLNCVGFNDKINVVVSKLIEKFLNPSFDKSLFDSIVQTCKRQIANEIFMEPFKNVNELSNSHLFPFHKSREERLKLLLSVSYDEVIMMPQIILNNVQTKISVMVLGNSSLDDAIGLTKLFLTFTSTKPLTKKQKYSKLNDDESFYKITDACNSSETNSAVLHTYKIKDLSYDLNQLDKLDDNWLKVLCMTNIFDSIISIKYYDQLRSSEQLGYITNAFPKTYEYGDYNMLSYGFLVQSSHTKSVQLLSRTNAFIFGEKDSTDNIGCQQILTRMTDEEYNTSVESLRAQLQKDHENFIDEIIYYSSIMKKGHDIFDLRERKYNMLGTITKQNIIDFFLKYFNEPTTWSVGINGK